MQNIKLVLMLMQAVSVLSGYCSQCWPLELRGVLGLGRGGGPTQSIIKQRGGAARTLRTDAEEP
jgi:hypothetical protein